MPKIEFTPDELKKYFTGQITAYTRDDAMDYADAIRDHADGLYPAKVIDQARPNEPDDVKEYRKKIWKPKTKPTFGKVFNSLSKIRRSADWAITYPTETFARIPDDETLEQYCEFKFPHFTSITNWVFAVLLREYLIDPNGVILMMPFDDEMPLDENGAPDLRAFVRPYPHIIDSTYVIDYEQGNFAVLENPIGTSYQTESGTWIDGKSFYIVTTQSIFRYDQTRGNNFVLAWEYFHNTGELPCEKIGAILKTVINGTDFLYESRIANMVAALDEAAREYSDVQAACVMNLYPERWEMASAECDACNGSGKIETDNDFKSCDKCAGTGDAPSPFSKILVKRGVGDAAVPIPPAGFVEKDVEIIKLMDQRVERHLFDALAAVNMEFLAKTPLNESGLAKEVDKDETNNFVHSVAEDLVRIMDWMYYTIARWRYGVQYPNIEEIKSMLPAIPVPEHFDLFSTKFVEERLITAKEKKYNPAIISFMERDYAQKEFVNSDSDVLDELELCLELDPLANITEDDKAMRLSNKGIRLMDYIISSNITSFVRRAMRADDKFVDAEYDDQRKVLEGYAKEIMDANKPEPMKTPEQMADEITNVIDPNNPANPADQIVE